MWAAILSDRLAVIALVSHYLTNKLIPRSPIPRQQAFAPATMQRLEIIRYYPGFPRAIPDLGAR